MTLTNPLDVGPAPGYEPSPSSVTRQVLRLNRLLKRLLAAMRAPLDVGPAPGYEPSPISVTRQVRRLRRMRTCWWTHQLTVEAFEPGPCEHRNRLVGGGVLKCLKCGKTEPWRGSYDFSD